MSGYWLLVAPLFVCLFCTNSSTADDLKVCPSNAHLHDLLSPIASVSYSMPNFDVESAELRLFYPIITLFLHPDQQPALMSSVGAKQLPSGSEISISQWKCPRCGGDVKLEWLGQENINEWGYHRYSKSFVIYNDHLSPV